MTEEEIMKEVIGGGGGDDDDDDDDDEEEEEEDDLHEDKEEEDLKIVYESCPCPTASVVMSVLDTLSIFGMFNDASVKDDAMAWTSKKAD